VRNAVARLARLFGPTEDLLLVQGPRYELPRSGTYRALLIWHPAAPVLATLLDQARPLLHADAVAAVASHTTLFGARKALRHAGYGRFSDYTIKPSLHNPATVLPKPGLLNRLRSARLLLAAHAGTPQLPTLAALPLLAGPDVGIEEVLCSEKDKTLVLAQVQGQAIVLRLPHTAAAIEAESRACATLTRLHTLDRLGSLLPRPRPRMGSDAAPAFVESRADGKPLGQVLTQGMRASLAPDVDRVLELLNPMKDGAVAAAAPLYPAYALPLLRRLSAELGDAAWVPPLARALEADLREASCRMGLVHGDFSVGNVFVRDGRLSGLIDWENTQWQAPPLLDAMNYMDSVERRCGGGPLDRTVPLLASGAWPVPQEADLLRRAFERSGADMRHRKGYAMLYGLSHVAPQLKFAAPGDPVGARIEQLVRWYLGSAA
jgi:aminoglycoside phosphotransferase (APT) family kinase protein